MIILNKRMLRILRGQPKIYRLSSGLTKLLEEGFVCKQQHFFFKGYYIKNPHITPDLFEDNTAYECFINSVHIEDFCQRNRVQNALLLISRMQKALTEMGCRYEIILTVRRRECILTFHSSHKGEVDWVDISKIEEVDCGIAIFRP